MDRPSKISAPAPANLRHLWMLKEGVAFLNHGSFGAMPREVFEVQEDWRRRIEAEPVEIIGRRHVELVEECKKPIGALLKMSPADFGMVTNATEGINAALAAVELGEGDELLTTTHVYNAVRQAMKYRARGAGATYREIDVRLPIGGVDDIARMVIDGLGPRTKLLLIDHVTSPTALVFPMNQIVAACRRRGIVTIIDGAHSPGMIDLDIPAIGADFYAGNLHKWCCCPKGSGFIWAAPKWREKLHPPTISHNYEQGITLEFAWQGTRDFSAWWSCPAALAFMEKLGWERVRERNHAMAVWAHELLLDRLGLEPLSPRDGSALGSMATIRLPGRLGSMSAAEGKALGQKLYTDHATEVPLFWWDDAWHLRVACAAYNEAWEYERLVEVLVGIV